MDDRARHWTAVQSNPTYWRGSLSTEEGLRVRWHSPAEERSSQMFCVSAFCGLRMLPDRDDVLGRLFEPFLGEQRAKGPWTLLPKFSRRDMLGETGAGTPTCVDVFCESPLAVVCVEGKLLFDAREGFGGCSQVKMGYCAGHYGPASDHKTQTDAFCRLTVPEGRRGARRYWEVARAYFQASALRQQAAGDTCPFAGSNFQLMRNYLFAAGVAGANRAFAVVCTVPAAGSALVSRQIAAFREQLLQREYGSRVGVRTYDDLAALLCASLHRASQELGAFLNQRLATLR